MLPLWMLSWPREPSGRMIANDAKIGIARTAANEVEGGLAASQQILLVLQPSLSLLALQS